MKNKILSVFLILTIFISIIPLNVSAATKETITIEWEKSTIKGNTYKIEYYHPKGYNKIRIYNISGSANGRNYNIVYYNDKTEFAPTEDKTPGWEKDEFTITNSSVITTKLTGLSYMPPTFADLENNTNNLLFNADETKRNNTFTKYTAEKNENYNYIGVSYFIGNQYKIIDSEEETFEILYAEWYYKEFGKYPPTITDMEENEYMKGNYYVILQQTMEQVGGGGGTSIDTGESVGLSTEGFVETCEDITINSKDGTNIYVVISSEKPTGDFMEAFNYNFFESLIEGIKGFFLSFVGENKNAFVGKAYNLMYAEGELGEERNGYVFANHYKSIFYNDEEYLNRYYFSSIEEASKFVLYGTAGAKYEYKETGKTHYGYGYNQIMYNNYDIDGYDTVPIPEGQYPLRRGNIILEWHEENVAEREYLWITFDYFPYATILSTDKVLTMTKYINPTYYIAYKTEENESTWNTENFLNYTKTDKYDSKKIQHFQIYFKGIKEELITNSWNLKWNDINLKGFKKTTDENGNTIIGSGSLYEDDWETEVGKDTTTGKEWIHNHLTDEYIEKGNIDHPYTDKDNDGIYENDLGQTFNPENFQGSMDDWYESLKEYTSNLENAAELIKDFTQIIDNANEEISQLTALLNAFYKNIPTIFRTLITLAILAIIITRILKR